MKIRFYTLLFILALFNVACDNFLELNPISEIGEESFYKTTKEIDKAVIACYNGLQAPTQYEWALVELHSDNSQMTIDNSLAVYTDYRELDNHTQTSLNPVITSYWQGSFHNIALCNQVLAKVNVVEDVQLNAQYSSECRFIRAYHYFNLVRLFGPVPLVLESISGSDAKIMERTDVATIYSFIESELVAAVAGLPGAYSASETGRITNWAAKALLAKVYLTEGKYSDAASQLSAIITSSPGLLLANYADVFDTSNEMNAEILFAVRFMSGNVGLGSPFANWFAPLTSGSNVVNGDGRGWNYPTVSLMNSWEDGDMRKDVCFKANYLNKTKNVVIERAYVNKFMYPVVDPLDAENDWPVLRFADVLLMYSEALNELQGVAEALPYLNQVRERAGLDALTESEILNKHQFRLALENERRHEFAFENHRYFDLQRTQRTLNVINEHYQTEAYYNNPSHPEFGVAPIEEWKTLLPVPQREIDVNPSLSQNIGY